MSIKITEQNFDTEVLQSAMPVVVDFWADFTFDTSSLF